MVVTWRSEEVCQICSQDFLSFFPPPFSHSHILHKAAVVHMYQKNVYLFSRAITEMYRINRECYSFLNGRRGLRLKCLLFFVAFASPLDYFSNSINVNWCFCQMITLDGRTNTTMGCWFLASLNRCQ